MALRLRRGTDAERLLVTPLQGELVYATDTKKIYVGDGATVGGVLVGPTDADAFTSVVNDTTPELGGELDLNGNDIVGTGSINITGSIHATGNITSDGDIGLGNDTSDVISVNGVINSSLRPALTDQYDLGSDARKWRRLLVNSVEANVDVQASVVYTDKIAGTDSTLFWDGATDSLSVGIVNANNVTVSGTFTASTLNGNLLGNVIADDSTVVVDANTKTAAFNSATIEGGTLDGVVIGSNSLIPVANINGDQIRAFGGFTGNLLGDVTGNVNGDIFGSVQGSVFGSDSSLLVDEDTNQFYGTAFNTDELTIGTRSITTNATDLFLGDAESPIPAISIYTNDNLKLARRINPADPAGGYITFSLGRGSHSVPEAVQAGDELGGMLMTAHTDGTENTALAGLVATAIADDAVVTPGATFVKSLIIISAATDTSQEIEDAFILDSAGVATSNAFSASKYMQLPVFADDAARLAAIPTPGKGMMVFMEAGTVPAATNQMQVFDGTNWVNAS